MRTNSLRCPVCGYLARDVQHPRRSHKVAAIMQLYDHIRVCHQDEISRRESRMARKAEGKG